MKLNCAIYPVRPADIAMKCIRLIWAHRRITSVRLALRHHVSVLRNSKDYTPRSLKSRREGLMKQSAPSGISATGGQV